ncbi:MAG: Hpt domain-containing protein [Thermodesulfobacteriota bacterium]
MTDLQWDRNFALEQAGDDEEVLAELLELFRQSARADLEKIKAGAAGSDPVAMGEAAHSIKGAAASLGVEAVRVAAYGIEKAGRSGDLAGAMQHLSSLERLLGQLEAMK